MLTKEEQSALNVIRNPEVGESIPPEFPALWKAERVLTNAILRLYPPGWNEPVTPERLEELKFIVVYKDRSVYRWTNDRYTVDCYLYGEERGSWTITLREYPYTRSELRGPMMPSNMLEARQLLERCGAIKETK